VILTGEQHQAMDCRGVLRGNADPFRASDAQYGESTRGVPSIRPPYRSPTIRPEGSGRMCPVTRPTLC